MAPVNRPTVEASFSVGRMFYAPYKYPYVLVEWVANGQKNFLAA